MAGQKKRRASCSARRCKACGVKLFSAEFLAEHLVSDRVCVTYYVAEGLVDECLGQQVLAETVFIRRERERKQAWRLLAVNPAGKLILLHASHSKNGVTSLLPALGERARR